MPRHRCRRQVATLLGLAALGSATVLMPADAATVAPTSASTTHYPSIYVKAVEDALAARSFHEVTSVTSKGFRSSGTEDALRNGGVESQELISSGTPFGFTARLVDGRLYLSGDQLTLVDIVGLSLFTGGFDAGKWLEVPRTSKIYEELVYGIDVKSGIAQIALGLPTTDVGRTVLNGRTVEKLTSPIGLHASNSEGPEQGTFTLYVTVGAHPLPVEEVQVDTNGTVTQTVTFGFSRWNRSVAVVRPAAAIPLP
jgi:hypothetical protein